MTTQITRMTIVPQLSPYDTGKVIQLTYLGHKDSHREFLHQLEALTGRIQRAAVQYSGTTTTHTNSIYPVGTDIYRRRDGRCQAREGVEAILKMEFSTILAANQAHSLLLENQGLLPISFHVLALERQSYLVLEEGDVLLNLRGIRETTTRADSALNGVCNLTRRNGCTCTVYSQPRCEFHSFGQAAVNDPPRFAPISPPNVQESRERIGEPREVFHLRGPSIGSSEDGFSSSGSLPSLRGGYFGTTATTTTRKARTGSTTTNTTSSPSVDGYSDADLDSLDDHTKATTRMTNHKKNSMIPEITILHPSDHQLDDFDQLALSMANFGVATPIVEHADSTKVPWHREKTIVAAPVKEEQYPPRASASASVSATRPQAQPQTQPQVLYSHVAGNRNSHSQSAMMARPANLHFVPSTSMNVSPPHTHSHSTTANANVVTSPNTHHSPTRVRVDGSSTSSPSPVPTMTRASNEPRSSISSTSSNSGSSGSDEHYHRHNYNHQNNKQPQRSSSSSSRTHRPPRQDKRLYVADPHQGPRPTDWMLSEDTMKSRVARDAKFAQIVALGLTKGRTKAQWAQARRPGKRDRDAAKQRLRELEEANE
ncbi:hypothetical protein FRC17_002924, partial [Serendipita sp. 399]